MADRITKRDLDVLVDRINRETNSPLVYGDRKLDGSFVTNIGHYCLDQAYGGNKLVRVDNESGGIREITYGFVSKRELYEKMQAFISGLIAAKEF